MATKRNKGQEIMIQNALNEYRKLLKTYFLAEKRGDRSELIRMYHVLVGAKSILVGLGLNEVTEISLVNDEVYDMVCQLTNKA